MSTAVVARVNPGQRAPEAGLRCHVGQGRECRIGEHVAGARTGRGEPRVELGDREVERVARPIDHAHPVGVRGQDPEPRRPRVRKDVQPVVDEPHGPPGPHRRGERVPRATGEAR